MEYEDIVPKLLEKIKRDFQEHFNGSEKIAGLYAKVRDGTATYAEANEFAIEAGEILAGTFKRNLSSAVLPDGKMYFNIADRTVRPMMEGNYDLITYVTSQVQKRLNEEAGIGIKAIVPEMNESRIRGIVDRVSSEDVYDQVAWLLDEPMVNFSQSIVDDFARVNMEFQHKAGTSPKIVRTVYGNCCAWCVERKGTYEYEDVKKTGDKVFQRHERCKCMVEYFPRKGKVKNVHSGAVRNKTLIEQSEQWAKEKEIEAEIGRFKRTFNAVPQSKVVEVMREDSKKWIDSLSEPEKQSIQKYSYNEGDKKPKFFERLNAMLRGEYPEDEGLRHHAENISNALKKSTIGENIICYRGIDHNYFADYKVGDYLSFSQFASTSVKSSGMFNKPVQIVVYVKKGTKGTGYIESISKKPKQRELLFDKDCVFKVLSNSKELIELEAM